MTTNPPKQDVVVLDIDIEPFLENRVLDAVYARQFPGAEMFALLGSVCRDHSVDCVTSDIYLRDPDRWAKVACVSNETTRFSEELLGRSGVVPVVCMSLESPIWARPFYRSIAEVSARYRHVVFWQGAEREVRRAQFHEAHWPYPSFDECRDGADWVARRFATMVCSNKLAFPPLRPVIEPLHPGQTARNLRAYVRRRIERSNPWFREEYQTKRLAAIEQFAVSPGFDLYGRGWNDTSVLPISSAVAVRAAYRGELAPLGKVDKVAEYRFSICFENAPFEGYVTEKIFDAFCAGNIPVYLGAPDVERLIPKESFVDMRDFSSFGELDRFLEAMTEFEAAGYLEAARCFMASREAGKFTQDGFVAELWAVLAEHVT